MNLNEMIVIDLPSLQSITLGNGALYGNPRKMSLLTMRSNNDIVSNDRM